MRKLNVIIGLLLITSLIAPLCSADGFGVLMDIEAEGEEPTGNLTAEFNIEVNYTTYTVNLTDNSTGEGDINITWWNWQLGDGSTSTSRNVTHTYDIDWSIINSTVDTVSIRIKLEVENETQSEYDWIAKVVTFTRPDAEVETYIELPMEMIVALMAVIIVIALVYVFLNVTEGVFKR